MSRAFIAGPRVQVAPTAHGPLDGLRFAVKDLIDVAGEITGGGNPDWRASHAPAPDHAACVAALLAAGATLDGKTITDELAYSLEGENHHDGTPLNPRWPHALPGGSSSGSASAVAAGDVDFALGTDTGGSVRVPAAFCGLWGMRPSHDAISLDGVLPFAPCFDTVGWMTRSIDRLAAVGDVLLPPAGPSAVERPARLVQVNEAFTARARHEPADAAILAAMAESFGAHEAITVFSGDAARWLACYQNVQDMEIDTTLGEWLRAVQPRFGPAIAPRFARLATLAERGPEHAAYWRSTLRELRHALDDTLDDGTVLVLPTTPVALLAKHASGETRGRFYDDALTLNAIATLGGLPQITLPFTDHADRPLALSIIGARGSDRALLSLARDLASRHEHANPR
ncbi:MAG TPA: amidase [Paraburkholderia sp.]|jgi:amidase|nr:amidase [Paraburkholderia sp.]